jgi:hypothetical protein
MTCRPLLVFAALLALLVFTAAPPAAAAPPPVVLAGQITNTTRDVTAPARFELTFTGDTIGGFLTVEKPLLEGRWPVEGTRRGAWLEIVCRQTPTTRIVFRGVLNATELRGTYIFGGGGELVQYGRFQATAQPAPPSLPPSPK